MQILAYTIVETTGRHRLERIPLYIAMCIGFTNTINGEEYHLYQSDYKYLLTALN
jgi:hypothetical protein